MEYYGGVVRKIVLWVSIIIFVALIVVFIAGVKIYIGQEFFEASNITHDGFRNDTKVNTIFLQVDGVKNGCFRIKASGWIGKQYDFDSAYVDINDRIAGSLLDRIGIKAIESNQKKIYYESDYVDYYGYGLFDGYPFDKHYLSSQARLVLIKNGIEIVLEPDEFIYSVYLDKTYKVSKFEVIPENIGRAFGLLASDEILMSVEREPWFICYFLLACLLVLIPIVTMASGDNKVSSIDTPAFILSVFAIRSMLVPEEAEIYQLDLYLTGIVWFFGVVKMGVVSSQLYRPEKDFVAIKRIGSHVRVEVRKMIRALRGYGEFM